MKQAAHRLAMEMPSNPTDETLAHAQSTEYSTVYRRKGIWLSMGPWGQQKYDEDRGEKKEKFPPKDKRFPHLLKNTSLSFLEQLAFFTQCCSRH